jgi:hypothetical protein
MRALVVASLVIGISLAAGCSGGGSPATASKPLVVHEWGTFTSLVASDGHVMDGLLHEDEPPPPFVHRRVLLAPESARTDGEHLTTSVTQRMETPVIYFHASEAMRIRIDVGFPQGIVTEWYPNAAAYLPAGLRSAADSLQVGGGAMSWDVSLQPDLVNLPSPYDDYIWVPAREVASTPLQQTGNPDERDRFIFYRGVGRFDTPFSAQSQPGILQLQNGGTETIPAAFLLYVKGTLGRVTPIGPIQPGSQTVGVQPKEAPIEDYVQDAASQLATALRATGLYADEAQAMVNTWSRSYFRTQGMRVLYILPRAWTDALLPLRIDPAPTELVRTLVGRVEVMTAEDEAALSNEVEMAAADGASLDIAPLGAFAEPKLRRALELVGSAQARTYCQALIAQAIDANTGGTVPTTP